MPPRTIDSPSHHTHGFSETNLSGTSVKPKPIAINISLGQGVKGYDNNKQIHAEILEEPSSAAEREPSAAEDSSADKTGVRELAQNI